MRPLPETDLARIAPLPRDEKRRALQQLKLGRPPYSYAPVRSAILDVLNVQSELVGPMPATPWQKISQAICKKSRSDAEELANLRVAEGLFNFVQARDIVGRRLDIFPLQLGVGRKVVFWQPILLTYEERAIIPFLDPRRAKGLTANGRRFALSMMHERIRAADPDFADVTLAVVQFTRSEEGPRNPLIYTDEGVELFTFEELDEMVRDTYELWAEILEERAAEDRRKSASGGGLF